VKVGERGDGSTAQVHPGRWLQQPHRFAGQHSAPNPSAEPAFGTQGDAAAGGNAVDEPETRVVAVALVLWSRVAQADDQFNRRHGACF
jgi:hypothetical protein